jgi:hypothetical protein
MSILGPGTGYVDVFLYEIEEQLKKDAKEGKRFQKTPIRPSAAGKCARELYFELMEYSGRANYEIEPYSAETHLLLNLGHSIESHLISNLRKYFSLCEVRYTQQVLDFGFIETVNDARLKQHLEGSMDLCFWSDQWKCVVDVKSKGDNYSFKARSMKWEEDSKKLAGMNSVQAISERAYWVDDLDAFVAELQDPFFEANFKQLNMYLNSKFIMDRGIDHGAIIQYHKSKSKLREIRFRPSKKLFESTVGKFHGVVKAVDENKLELAPAEYEASSFKSRYCNYCQARVPGSCAMVNKKEGKK